jgi:hypothetical protein
VAWGDYDNDGHLDILLTGSKLARVYRNSGGANPTFSQPGAFLPGVQGSSAAWGDFDNDGDLDILLAGFSSPSFISKVYRNICAVSKPFAGALGPIVRSASNEVQTVDTPPTSPTNLWGRIDASGLVRFSWSPSTDAQTPSPGLSYNLRIGTAPGASNILSPMANPATGFRRVPALLGNVNQNTSWEIQLPGPGTYYWSVQAVDGSSVGSAFAPEETPTGTEENSTPLGYGLWSRGPNPFSGSTIIQFSQPAAGRVSIVIYDLAGHRVRTLVDESLRAGPFTRSWDGKNDAGRIVGSGVYLIRMKTGAFVKTQKVAVVR